MIMDKTSIRQFPEQAERVETGPIQFGQDWPGIFLRGDNAGPEAMYLGLLLSTVESYNEENPNEPLADAFLLMALRGLQETLSSCMFKHNCVPE